MQVVNQLIDLVDRLYKETDGYIEQQDNSQLWYNRGYANGVIKALQDAGFEKMLLIRLSLDAEQQHADEQFVPWGKAYFHGYGMGEKEAKEVLP